MLEVTFDLTSQTNRFVDCDRCFLAFDPDPVEFAEYHFGHFSARGFPDNHLDAILLGYSLQSRSKVHCVSHYGVRQPYLRTHVADAHPSGVDSHADVNRRPAFLLEMGLQLREYTVHFHARQHRMARVLRIMQGRAPEGHDAIPHILVDRAAVLIDDS